MQRAQFFPLRDRQDGIDPQWHLRAREVEKHGEFTSVHSVAEEREVVLEIDATVGKALRRLTDMFFKDFRHIFSKSALFLKSDQFLETWDIFTRFKISEHVD